jgi:hypothetical protein
MKKKVTNKTRKLGWGYNTEHYSVDSNPYAPTKPNFVGNLKQIREQIATNKEFQAVKISKEKFSWSFFYGDERIVDIKPVKQNATSIMDERNLFELVWEFLNDGTEVEITTERVE